MSDDPVWTEAEAIGKNQYVRSVLWLIKNGIPFDVAFSLTWPEVLGWSILFIEIESGKQYNWSTHKFQDR
jgi:hypothetical protein